MVTYKIIFLMYSYIANLLSHSNLVYTQTYTELFNTEKK